MDYDSEEILFELDPDHQIYPASMTKIMTSIIAFDLIKQKISLDDKFLYQKMLGGYLNQAIRQCLL